MPAPKLLALAALLALLGLGGGLAWQDAELECRHEADANARLSAFRMAVEQYAIDNYGSYPREADVAAALTGFTKEPPYRPYLAGAQGVRNPWSATGAPMKVYHGPWPKALNAVGPVARGEVVLSPAGTDLGPGHYPGDGPDDHLTYGTLLYAYDPDSQVYIACVVGKRGDRAVVLGATSNCTG